MRNRKQKLLCLLLALLLLIMPGCGSTSGQGSDQDTIGEGADTMRGKGEHYSILFIGNSYTFYNDMPTAFFEPMAKACGYDVTVTSITKGAYTLEKFADPSDPYGAIVSNALSGATQYDFVIIQEQSVRPAINAPAFYDGVRALASKIREIGAQPILYATWGRKDGSDKLDEHNMTSEEMTWLLSAAYDAIGAELDIPVVHVGLAFRQVYTSSAIELYNADKSHPSVAGSYLAAMALVSKIFGVNANEISLSGPVGADDDAIIRSAVQAAVEEDPEIPENYKTVSTDVTAPAEQP